MLDRCATRSTEILTSDPRGNSVRNKITVISVFFYVARDGHFARAEFPREIKMVSRTRQADI